MASERSGTRTGGFFGLGEKGIYRAASLSTLVFLTGYLVIIALYVLAGVPPKGGEAWLTYGAGKTALWWGIIGLSVLTDVLLVPVALALYLALKGLSRSATLAAVLLIGTFVVLDLAVTWPNYVSLVSLASTYGATTNGLQQAIYVTAANQASAVLTSPAEAILSILVPSIGILIAGIIMLKGVFGKGVGFLGLITGVLGIPSVASSILGSVLSSAVILTSVLTAVWVLLVGRKLHRLSVTASQETLQVPLIQAKLE